MEMSGNLNLTNVGKKESLPLLIALIQSLNKANLEYADLLSNLDEFARKFKDYGNEVPDGLNKKTVVEDDRYISVFTKLVISFEENNKLFYTMIKNLKTLI